MLTDFNHIETKRPQEKDPVFNLTIKIGVGYGRCQELGVGDPNKSMEFVLTGTAVDEAATFGPHPATEHLRHDVGAHNGESRAGLDRHVHAAVFSELVTHGCVTLDGIELLGFVHDHLAVCRHLLF